MRCVAGRHRSAWRSTTPAKIGGVPPKGPVVYLASADAEHEASHAHLTYAVISSGQAQKQAIGQFRAAGWKIQALDTTSYWTLAVAPNATNGACT